MIVLDLSGGAMAHIRVEVPDCTKEFKTNKKMFLCIDYRAGNLQISVCDTEVNEIVNLKVPFKGDVDVLHQA